MPGIPKSLIVRYPEKRRLTRSSGASPDERAQERYQRRMRRSRSRPSRPSNASSTTPRDSPEAKSKEREKSVKNGKDNSREKLVANSGSRKKGGSPDGDSDSHADHDDNDNDLDGSEGGEGATKTRSSIQDTEGNETTTAADSKPKAKPIGKKRKSKASDDERRKRPLSLSGNVADEMQSPVKEISFTREAEDRRHRRSPKKQRTNPTDLDDRTLRAVREYISRDRMLDTLQDDEVTQFMVRMNRNSSRQADYQLHLVGDSDESEATLFMELLAEEEDRSVSHEMFKTMVARLRREQKDAPLDPRTLGWIKRASGIHRPQVESLARQHAIETDTSRMMKTRTAARRSRARKQDVGVSFLVEAMEGLDLELSLPAKPPAASKSAPAKPAATAAAASKCAKNEENQKVQQPKKVEEPDGVRLVARIRKRRTLNGAVVEFTSQLSVSRVLVRGRQVVPGSPKKVSAGVLRCALEVWSSLHESNLELM
jgi:hypothetical protein